MLFSAIFATCGIALSAFNCAVRRASLASVPAWRCAPRWFTGVMCNANLMTQYHVANNSAPLARTHNDARVSQWWRAACGECHAACCGMVNFIGIYFYGIFCCCFFVFVPCHSFFSIQFLCCTQFFHHLYSRIAFTAHFLSLLCLLLLLLFQWTPLS